ncbi:MAG: arginine deiminase [Lachnospiraceae bacterium]
MSIHVTSEIKRLKKVLLHRPGRELEQLTPDSLEQLLFDDIPYLKAAQAEHDYFAGLLSENGVEVEYLEDLMAETITQDKKVKEQFVHEYIEQSGIINSYYMKEMELALLQIPDEKDLVYKTMAGISFADLPNADRGPLSEMLDHKRQLISTPLPNLYFTRDPFAVIGEGVSMNHMYTGVRNRETIYGRYILGYHPGFRGKVPFYYQPDSPFSIEGGDILNLSDTVLAVGLSQRTSSEGIELLAKNLFKESKAKIETILAFDIPNLRAYMHLDTVFTQADTAKFVVHPNILGTLRIFILRKKDGKGSFTVEQSRNGLARTLEDVLHLDNVTLINCGGQDRVASAREQWNDGANMLCIRPGVVVAYDRNNITNKILRDMGITVLELPSSELSRGRGGPRCMSMPLNRES